MRKTGRPIKNRRKKVPTALSVGSNSLQIGAAANNQKVKSMFIKYCKIAQLCIYLWEVCAVPACEWISLQIVRGGVDICEMWDVAFGAFGVASCSVCVSVCLCPCPCVCMQCPCPYTRRYLCMREFGRRLLASSEPYVHTPPTYHWAPPPLYSPIISMLNL